MMIPKHEVKSIAELLLQKTTSNMVTWTADDTARIILRSRFQDRTGPTSFSVPIAEYVARIRYRGSSSGIDSIEFTLLTQEDVALGGLDSEDDADSRETLEQLFQEVS